MSPIPPVNATWTSFNTTTPMAQGSNESPWAMDLSTLVQIVFGVLGIIKTAVNFFYNRSKIQGRVDNLSLLLTTQLHSVMLGLGTGRQAPDQNLAHDECKICNRPASVSTARSIDSGKYLWSQSKPNHTIGSSSPSETARRTAVQNQRPKRYILVNPPALFGLRLPLFPSQRHQQQQKQEQ